MSFQDRKIIDGHLHYPHYSYADALMGILANVGIDKLAVVCTPHDKRLRNLETCLFGAQYNFSYDDKCCAWLLISSGNRGVGTAG